MEQIKLSALSFVKGVFKLRKGRTGKNIKAKRIIQVICAIVLIITMSCIVYYFYNLKREKEDSKPELEDVPINVEEVKPPDKTERMLQLEELQKENNEIIGWLEIEGTTINYPVCQTNNNDYYLNHNYKKENSSLGSLFLDKDFDLVNGSTNYLIYGHRTTTGLMFEDLIKYSNEDFYKEHTKIRFTTATEDATYEIISVFYSRVYYKSEKNVFRYYYFVNAKDELEYNDFVTNAKKASIYNIETSASYGDQLLTLSTCEYSQEDGRFAVVAKKI